MKAVIRASVDIEASDLKKIIERLFVFSARKISELHKIWNFKNGSPVITRAGTYTSREWTNWTQGFFFGMPLLQYDFDNDKKFLELGYLGTASQMPVYLTDFAVHDHGFNVVSTYGNLLRLSYEGRLDEISHQADSYKLALKVSGAVQAMRWTELSDELGYIYSFNGRHSLFADTIRSLRSLAVAHQLGHVLIDERGRRIDLLRRLIQHAEITARYIVYLGEERDIYDVPGRVAHEAIFNVDSRTFRCPSTQQGYSPFSTWTRGMAWILCGYAEELEFITHLGNSELEPFGGKDQILKRYRGVAESVADFYIANTPTDGIPYWDTGAPGLSELGDYLNRAADPFNDYEPVDSSAAVIAAQGLIRLGNFMIGSGDTEKGNTYLATGLTVAGNVLSEPYLSSDPRHQGLILHSVYHRPRGWDYVLPGKKNPSGEASMWGDYHALELALLIYRIGERKKYPTFFSK